MPLTTASVRLERDRRLRRIRLRTADEIRRSRIDAGLTLSALAAIIGIHRTHLARIEAGTATPSLDVLVAIGVALGADLSIRYFHGSGPRLVDRFQAPMIEAFLRDLHPRWSSRLEVPVESPVRGVIDAALFDSIEPTVVATEFQSELRRLEQQVRWSNEKADGLAARLVTESDRGIPPTVSRLLVLRSTLATRELARTYETTLRAAYPARCVDVLNALRSPTHAWPGAGIVWMRVANGLATVLDRPPRGVHVGR